MFKRSIINRYLAAAAALTTAAALVFLPCASFISRAEEADIEDEEEYVIAEETVDTVYYDEDGEPTATGSAIILFDTVTGEILATDYYDEDGEFLFRAEIDPEADIRLYAKYAGRPAL